MAGFCWLLVVAVACCGLVPVHAAEYRTGAIPAWVVPVEPGQVDGSQRAPGNDGVAYLLTDTQILAGSRERVRYHRMVAKALSAEGVETIANIQIPYDPSYQSFVLHELTVVRKGRSISQLHTARIRVIQREAGLDEQIFDGTRTVTIVLSDVRPGDVVDYAYSVSGRNPVFGGRDFGTYALQYGVSIARIHARLLIPADEPLAVAYRHTAMRAVVSEHDGLRDYVWDVAHPVALNVEGGAPDWYSPYAQVSWSEFADWAQVVDWALPLYQVPSRLDAGLQAEVDRIARESHSPGARMLAALRLVQGQVRYLGVEIGPNSHAPNPPALVYARRFGDCKDKTLLAITLLRRLGIDAWPALVNTDVQRGIADELPSPGVFDHVLVYARADGRNWWIDPTRKMQMADLAHLEQDHFGKALVVAPGTRALSDMPKAAPDASQRRLLAVYDARQGFDKPVPFTLQTVAQGRVADGLRAGFASTPREDVQKTYLNYYANTYPRIAVAAPLRVRDEESVNRLTTDESYTISDLSEPSDDSGREALIQFPDITALLRDPATPIRKAPLWRPYPEDVSQRTEVLLPGDWPIKPHVTRIDNPAFRFEQTVKKDGARLIVTDHFQSLADEVAVADMGRYLADLARARKLVGYRFWWDPALAAANADRASGPLVDRVNWLVLVVAGGMCLAWVWLARRLYRYDPSPARFRDDHLAGIAGWLVLLAVALVARLLFHMAAIWRMRHALAIERWTELTTYGSHVYSGWWAPALLFELAANLLQWVVCALLLVLLFKRRSSFPRIALVYLLGGLVLVLLDHWLSGQVPAVHAKGGDLPEVAGGAVWVVAWCAYLLRSRRVKATFVNRLDQPVPPPLPRAVLPPELTA